MLTAHVPAGYILGRMVPRTVRWLMPAALLGAALPDTDMLWFHLVDHGHVHHHRYWLHIPAFWAALALVTLPILQWRGLLATGLVFFASILLHLCLDTIAGGIMWLYPADDRLLALVEVPPRYGNWMISFMLHWTFLLELVTWAVALSLFVSHQIRGGHAQQP